MRTRTKALLIMLVAPAALIVLQIVGPTLVARGFARWLTTEARRAGCELRIRQSDAAGWLAPVVLHDVEISRGDNFDLRIVTAKCRLSLLTSLLSRGRERVIRSLDIDGLTGSVYHAGTSAPARSTWLYVDRVLPREIRINAPSLQFDVDGSTLILRDGNLTAGGATTGSARIGLLAFNSPLLHQELRDLATFAQWREQKFTLGTIRLGGGVNLESIEFDLSRLREARVAANVNAEVFEGRLRGTFATEPKDNARSWDIAASTSEVPLASITTALGLRDAVTGKVHASKFTFRGDPHRLKDATCSVWLELTGLQWKNRAADTLMFGAILFNRQLDLQQLYIKQRSNEVTMSGETALRADWLNADFRGDVTATINDIGALAQLFGARESDFAGRLSVEGSVKTRERKVSGQLVAAGRDLTIFGAAVDSLTSRVIVDQTKLTIDDFELRRGSDSTKARAVFQARSGNIEELTIVRNSTSAAFSGYAQQSDNGVSITLVPSESLFVSASTRALSCVSGFDYSETDDELEVSEINFETNRGLRLMTSAARPLAALSPDEEMIDLPFCAPGKSAAGPLRFLPRATLVLP